MARHHSAARYQTIAGWVLVAIGAAGLLAMAVLSVVHSDGQGRLRGMVTGSWIDVRCVTAPPGPGLPPAGMHRVSGPLKSGMMIGGVPIAIASATVSPLTAIPVVCAGVGAALVLIARFHARSRRAWECAQCGYDRRGLAADAACPECGTRHVDGATRVPPSHPADS